MMNAARLRWVGWALAAWACVVALRLVQVQVVQHRTWEAGSARQREHPFEVEEPRGDIVSRDGRILAGSLERVAVYANPRKIPHDSWSSVATSLSPLVGLPASTIMRQLRDHDGFFYLAKDLDPEIRDAVAKLQQRGVGTIRNERRVYPHGSLAGPVVGFINAEGDGQAGLEAFYDRTLRGLPSVYRVLQDGKKTTPTFIDLRLESEGRPGQSLAIALDCRVQEIVEQELERTVTETGAKGASAVVLDPSTGELLALASVPSYDPGHLAQSGPQDRHDRGVEDALEPGSTFKPFIVAAAISAGVLDPSEMVDCSGGGVMIANVFFHDHARYGLLPVREVLAKSSNAGAIRIAYRVGPGQLDDVIRRFGFGQPTGVELPAETRGIYRGPQSWSALSRAGLALGQEISVTPLQLAQAYAAIANGGLLMHPRLVRETRDRSGAVVTPYKPQPGVRVIPADVAARLATMLEGVVEEGTGKAAEVPGFTVAGKTGTAQRAFSGSYTAGRHVAWFAGFLPMPSPDLVIVVCVDEPVRQYWAADVAAPVFGRIAARTAILLGLEPTSGVRV
ncbi:MAG TPA: penicillin-binding protein 2 [Thermoanaerobaculaceae bacterium]|nr:penicillin-binding protein 2 [Thermoanaerobaculaceae bacterium]